MRKPYEADAETLIRRTRAPLLGGRGHLYWADADTYTDIYSKRKKDACYILERAERELLENAEADQAEEMADVAAEAEEEAVEAARLAAEAAKQVI